MENIVFVDVSTSSDLSLIAAAHRIVSSTFDPDDVEPLSHWQSVLPHQSADRNPRIHCIVGMRDNNVLSVSHVEYYQESKCALWVYWAVEANERQLGLGRLTFQACVDCLSREHPGWKYLFAETHAADVDDPVMDPRKRQQKFHQMGFVQVPLCYTLPALADHLEPPHGYVFVALPHVEQKEMVMDAEILRLFLKELFQHGLPWLTQAELQPSLEANLSQIEGKEVLILQPTPPWYL
jgi:hypothetical protein